MSWYSQMLKSQELARERNRREERRVRGEKYGPQFVANYHLAELNKEKRLIEKELERIRKGIHKQPKLDEHVNHRANHILSVPPNYKHQQTINPEYSKEEDHLYDAILFLQNNPSALVPILSAHAHSDAYLETLERVTPRLTHDAPPNTSFKPKYLSQGVSRTEKAELVNKYTALLQRHSPMLRRSSPLTSRRKVNSPLTHRDGHLLHNTAHRDSPLLYDATHRDSPLLHDATPIVTKSEEEKETSTHAGDGKTEAEHGSATQTSTFLTLQTEECQSETHVQSATPRQKRPLSIAKLTDDGMTSARENVSRRLSNKDNNSYAQSADYATPNDDVSDDKKSRPKEMKAVVMFPSLDPEVYTATGELRTCLNMPDFESRWEEANKASYIRTKHLRERDRELSVQEIFEKPNKGSSQEELRNEQQIQGPSQDYSKGGPGKVQSSRRPDLF